MMANDSPPKIAPAPAAASEGVAEERIERRCQPGCPVCGGSLVNIRQKLQCARCHTIVETCCEGGRG